ncbi:hypothetical protein [Pelagivirga sediminicola]|nr:hypothetical protein [Pelagivirga sediminicola]
MATDKENRAETPEFQSVFEQIAAGRAIAAEATGQDVHRHDPAGGESDGQTLSDDDVAMADTEAAAAQEGSETTESPDVWAMEEAFSSPEAAEAPEQDTLDVQAPEYVWQASAAPATIPVAEHANGDGGAGVLKGSGQVKVPEAITAPLRATLERTGADAAPSMSAPSKTAIMVESSLAASVPVAPSQPDRA